MALERAEYPGFLDRSKKRPNKSALEEFLLHGLKYVYPAKPGAVCRGIPTSHSALPLSKHIVSNAGEIVMVRYKTTGNIEDQYEPGGFVLKNKLGIRSKKSMDGLEFQALRKTQLHFLDLVTAKTRLTDEMILAAHKHFLGGLYDWAGKYRTVNISKPGFVWPPSGLVARNMEVFEKEVLWKHTPCRRGPLEKVAEAIAIVHAEFLLVHPFREGNGRIARLIADIMALQAGYPPPDFDFRSRKNQKKYIEAVKKGYLRDCRELAELVAEAMRAPKKG